MSVRVTVKISDSVLKQLAREALETLLKEWASLIKEEVNLDVGLQVISIMSGLNSPSLTIEVEYDVMGDFQTGRFLALERTLLSSMLKSSLLPNNIGVATLFKPVNYGRHTVRRRA